MLKGFIGNTRYWSQGSNKEKGRWRKNSRGGIRHWKPWGENERGSDIRHIAEKSVVNLYSGMTKDKAFFMGQLVTRCVHSLTFARTTHTAHSLCSALLCHACFTRQPHSWACSPTLLTPSWNNANSQICVHTEDAFNRKNRVCCLHLKHTLRKLRWQVEIKASEVKWTAFWSHLR